LLFNTTIATAIADRLVENSEIFSAWRRQSTKDQQESDSAGGLIRRLQESAALW
jgi:hypothetical protein